MGVGGERHAPAALPPRMTRHPFVQKAAWVRGPVSTGTEDLSSTGIRFPDRPARSESLLATVSRPTIIIIIILVAYNTLNEFIFYQHLRKSGRQGLESQYNTNMKIN